MSTSARGLSHVGYCVRAVVVFDMVDVSSVVSCVFFVVGGRGEEVAHESREKGDGLNLR